MPNKKKSIVVLVSKKKNKYINKKIIKNLKSDVRKTEY